MVSPIQSQCGKLNLFLDATQRTGNAFPCSRTGEVRLSAYRRTKVRGAEDLAL